MFARPRYFADLFPGNRVGVVLGIFIPSTHPHLSESGFRFFPGKFFNAVSFARHAISAFDQRKKLCASTSALGFSSSRAFSTRAGGVSFVYFVLHAHTRYPVSAPALCVFSPVISCFFFHHIYFRLCDANRIVAFRPPPENVPGVSRIESRDPSSCRSLFTGFHVPTHRRINLIALRVGSIVLEQKKNIHLDIARVECISVRNVPSRYLYVLSTFTSPLNAFRSRRRSSGRTRGLRARFINHVRTRVSVIVFIEIPAAVRGTHDGSKSIGRRVNGCRFENCFRTNVASVTNIVKYDTRRFITFLRCEKKFFSCL